MLRALLVTHGDLARSLLATARTIVGTTDDVETLSNEGLSRDGLAELVGERVDTWGGADGVVLTDILGGSCTQAALLGLTRRPNVAVLCGVNLPMLVDFLMNRERFGLSEMSERLVEKARHGVRAFPPRGAAAPPGGEGSGVL